MDKRILNQSEVEYDRWLEKSVERNPNLKPLAEELSGYDADRFSAWIERALIRIIIEGRSCAISFSPGELIVGTSDNDWRDDLLPVIALLNESAKASISRGVVMCFDAVAPRPDDNDITANIGRNWEHYVVDLMRLVRDLRPPLCNREATPLRALLRLLTVRFPRSHSVFAEGLLLWRTFAHQMEDPDTWAEMFQKDSRFRLEYAPLIAFAHVARFPSKADYFLMKWPPYVEYRREVASERLKDQAKALCVATIKAIEFVNKNGIALSVKDLEEAEYSYSFVMRHTKNKVGSELYVRDPSPIAEVDKEVARRRPRSLDEIRRRERNGKACYLVGNIWPIQEASEQSGA